MLKSILVVKDKIKVSVRGTKEMVLANTKFKSWLGDTVIKKAYESTDETIFTVDNSSVDIATVEHLGNNSWRPEKAAWRLYVDGKTGKLGVKTKEMEQVFKDDVCYEF